MRKSLLEIVQEILNEMDSDNVNSISDTIESEQVAEIVRSCYNEIISNRNWPHLRQLIQFTTSSLARPTHLRLPEGVRELTDVKYDIRSTEEGRKEYHSIIYLRPEEFLEYTNKRDSSSPSVTVVSDITGVDLLIKNNKAPTYYTSFDDDYLVFDSYNSDIEDTLMQNKSQGIAYMEPTWSHTDNAYPDLPPDAFSQLIEEAKSVSFLTLKQMANEKAEQRAGRQARWLAMKAWRINGDLEVPNYGRK